jgi:hypothetical protein
MTDSYLPLRYKIIKIASVYWGRSNDRSKYSWDRIFVNGFRELVALYALQKCKLNSYWNIYLQKGLNLLDLKHYNMKYYV